MHLALIINTYNQPDYLTRVLNAVSRQIHPPTEVLLADDGSAAETREVFARWATHQPWRCEQVWQEHTGFRRARILNATIARTHADYLVFLDGDTLPHPRFLQDHHQLHQAGCYVQGHRALIQQSAASWFGLGPFPRDRARALLTGQLHGLQHAFRWPRPWCRPHPGLRGTRGCNLAIARADLVAVNGYNEAFEGWGREDSELALRLQNQGVRRLDVRGWALCYHLWHPPAPRSQLAQNDTLLDQARQTGARRCPQGLDRHAPPPTSPS